MTPLFLINQCSLDITLELEYRERIKEIEEQYLKRLDYNKTMKHYKWIVDNWLALYLISRK